MLQLLWTTRAPCPDRSSGHRVPSELACSALSTWDRSVFAFLAQRFSWSHSSRLPGHARRPHWPPATRTRLAVAWLLGAGPVHAQPDGRLAECPAEDGFLGPRAPQKPSSCLHFVGLLPAILVAGCSALCTPKGGAEHANGAPKPQSPMSAQEPISNHAPPSQALGRRVEAGDPEAIDALIRTHLPAIQRRASLLLGRKLRSVEESRDLAQSTLKDFIRVVRGGRFRWKDTAAFLQYVAGMMRRKVCDHAHRNDRRVSIARFQALDDLGSQLAGTAEPPSVQAQRKESIAAMQHALAKLPAQQRDLLWRLGRGESNQAIAAALGIPAKQVPRLKHRAIAAFLAERARLLPSSSGRGE